ncbi:MAG: glycoside hydrolase family 127 protein, partial [Bacteroidia bacterium]|nr:glycoside hydrolase family 127 protein [Bacteroidia bacterium]
RGVTWIKLNEKWKDGDRITLQIPMNIRYERRYNNSVSMIRGPLYFSLRMEKEYKSVKINYDNFAFKGSIDWEIYPKSPWNYGLLIDMRNPMRGIKLEEKEVGSLPFSDRGDMLWSEDSVKYIASQTDAPLIIRARGIRIPSWTIKNNSADVPPLSPVRPEGDPEIIELVPYGCARLRITEFPVMDVTLMEEVIK